MRAIATAVLVWLAAATAQAQQPLIGGDPLVGAVLDGDVATARALLVSGSIPQGRDLDRRPLTVIAVNNNDAAMLDLLLGYGANPNLTDARGNSPLLHACALNNLEAVERLIEAGAQVNWANQQGITPLIRAAQVGAIGAIRLLLEHGAVVDLTDYTGRDAAEWAELNSHQRAAEMLRVAAASG